MFQKQQSRSDGGFSQREISVNRSQKLQVLILVCTVFNTILIDFFLSSTENNDQNIDCRVTLIHVEQTRARLATSNK